MGLHSETKQEPFGFLRTTITRELLQGSSYHNFCKREQLTLFSSRIHQSKFVSELILGTKELSIKMLQEISNRQSFRKYFSNNFISLKPIQGHEKTREKRLFFAKIEAQFFSMRTRSSCELISQVDGLRVTTPCFCAKTSSAARALSEMTGLEGLGLTPALAAPSTLFSS